MLWFLGTLLLVGVALVLFWWIRKRRRYRLISLVALAREPMTFDSAVLARVAGKAWNADLGDGEQPGEDGFVLCTGIVNTIHYKEHFFLVNSLPRPYAEDLEQVAAGIVDRRIRALFLEHKAWFSFDAMGIDGRTPEEEVRQRYRDLGKLLAEFLDNNCLLIYLPDTSLAYPINEDTEAALRSNDPLTALRATETLPVIEVAPDDPAMQKAVQQAREGWPKFLAAYEANAGTDFGVKAPVTAGGNTEFIWISVTSIEGDRIYGELANEPANLGTLTFGSKVSVAVADLNDWCYIDNQERPVGLFTVEAVKRAARRKRGN